MTRANDHYFENKDGTYYLDKDGKYKPINDTPLAENDKRYSFDANYCYPNENGGYKRVNGGIAIDLSYFNVPSIYIDSSELDTLVEALLGGLVGGGNGEAMSVAATSADDSEDEDNKITFPLITDDELLGYIRTFVYGFSVTSRYIQLLVQPDFINSILALLLDEDTTIKFDEEKFVNKPALTIYSDMTSRSLSREFPIQATRA